MSLKYGVTLVILACGGTAVSELHIVFILHVNRMS